MLDVRSFADATLADQVNGVGDSCGEVGRVFQVSHERSEVSIVDADERCFELQDSVEVLGIVDFNQAFHAEFGRVEVEVAHRAVVEAFGDQQNAVRSGGSGFGNLVAVQDEIFPHHRYFDRVANGGQVFQLTLEVRLVREATDAGCASGLVSFRDFDWIKVFADQSG